MNSLLTVSLVLWDRHGDLKWLQKHVTPLRGPRRTIKVCLVNPCDFAQCTSPHFFDPLQWKGGYDDPWTDTSILELEVQDFELPSDNVNEHSLSVIVADCNGGTVTQTCLEHYAIPSGHLPSLEKLETWVLENTRHSQRPFFNSGVHGTFFAFALRYCHCKNELPLVSLKTSPTEFEPKFFFSKVLILSSRRA
jgi:hypothetical protein